MAEQAPSKIDITAIFKRLRSIQTNKVCFDCNAKNPTWASVTYGVFICIDCSAIHRSLGVHLSFVRSTNLDTNWTWLQLRAMQVGGNANAITFFRQHNCTSTDSQQKYNSRAAQLYRERLHHLAVNAMRTHGTKLHLETAHDHPSSPEVKEVDFFEAHEQSTEGNENNANNNHEIQENGLSSLAALSKPTVKTDSDLEGLGPNVEAALSTSPTEALKQLEARKPTIGTRKATPVKKGMGARKGGLGAQKVTTNFTDIEREAQLREQAAAEEKERHKMTKAEEEKQFASMRLAYQDLSIQQQKEEDRLRQYNPKKATQFERLGMGFGGRSMDISHSATSEMKTIEQESPNKAPTTFSSRSSKERDFFEDEYEFVGFTPGPPKYGDSPFSREERSIYGLYSSKPTVEDKYGINRSASWHTEKPQKITSSFSDDVISSKDSDDSGRSRKSYSNASTGNEAVKKFGNAKAISSEQFFSGGRDNDYERKANLARFEGSSSISSSDYFGDSTHRGSSSSSSSNAANYNGPDLDDIKEGVRAGVTKVAGKLSNLANGVMNSLQDRYGTY